MYLALRGENEVYPLDFVIEVPLHPLQRFALSFHSWFNHFFHGRSHMASNASALSTWPLLASESQRALILPILDELDLAFGSDYHEVYPSLSGGSAGTALFLGYLSMLPGREALKERAMELLGHAVENVRLTPGAQFYGGYSGIAWAVEHMQQYVFEAEEGADEEDANEGVDEVLQDLLTPSPWQSDYDLISGLAGYGVYALERLSKPSARKVLAKILDHLEALALPRATGHAWPTPAELLPPWQRKIAPNGYLNLGLAHGNPAVLLLLAAMEKAGRKYPEIDSARAKKLLEGGMAWFFSQFQSPQNGSYLAGWCPVEQEKVEAPDGGSRVAWCYGDLGASIAILNAARLVERTEWEAKALDMARLAAARTLETSGVRDVGLCHGSAGNMLLFQRLFHLTGEACFKQAAQMYLEHAIHTRDKGGPFAGYTSYHPDMDEDGKPKEGSNPYKPEAGLLEGAAGVGLALLASLGVEPKWDRFMMLSLPEIA
jgi:lantibiotic modifying enzyme